MRGLSEHAMQVAVIEWAQLQACVLWPLELLYAVPNGGKRPPRVGRKMKAEGQRKGVLDLVLPVPAAGWLGLYLEMKTATGPVSPDQKWWAERLRAVGQRVEVCRSIEHACEVLRHHALAAAVERPQGFGLPAIAAAQKAKPPTGGKGASGCRPEKAISTEATCSPLEGRNEVNLTHPHSATQGRMRPDRSNEVQPSPAVKP